MSNPNYSALSRLAMNLGQSEKDLSLYNDDFNRPTGFKPVIELLADHYKVEGEFNCARAAALLDADPAFFSMNDIELALRGAWKSDRVGFYKGGNTLFRNGWISRLIKAMESPKATDMCVPQYPTPETRERLKLGELWASFEGFYQG